MTQLRPAMGHLSVSGTSVWYIGTDYLKQTKQINFNNVLNKSDLARNKLIYDVCYKNGDHLKEKANIWPKFFLF